MTRRTFVAAAGVLVGPALAGSQPPPWYKRTYRWGQTNITEKDPIRYDIPWWREYWKRTRIQGVIINAGGIVAYYPSELPLQHRAEFLNGRDLYGELVSAAHADGLAVLARMDSNRTGEDFFAQHPDWFARDIGGQPYRAGDKYITCVNSPYYTEYIPAVLREIIGRSHPEGVTDNSWSGLGRDSICYCENCARAFRNAAGASLPRKHDWDDAVFRRWIDWNYARRLEIWDFNNRVTKSAGGPDCLWLGMNSGSVLNQARSFRDCRAVWTRAEILMLDHQSRGPAGFQENADTGNLVHSVMGWDKIVPESMAMYQAGTPYFRHAAKPAAEARMWMIEGLAGGIQPWWHHIGAYQEDRRAYQTAEPVLRWVEENQPLLVNCLPLATVGVVWSQRNTDFYGRDDAADLVEAPYRGFVQALVRARIPYVPVHIDDIERRAASLKALILPNIAAMSDAQAAAVRRFAQSGGAVIATGVTSLYTDLGDPRSDFALADLFGTHWLAAPGEERAWASQSAHSYVRLLPELRAHVWGPEVGDEPKPAGARHPVLKGFDETDIIGYGGTLVPVRTEPGVSIAFTFVPDFPTYPPETSWMRTPVTDIPGLVTREGERIAFMPADLDRRYARNAYPDHGTLLANLVRWAAEGEIPIKVKGPGLLDCRLYSQPGRAILHVVNLTGAGSPFLDEDALSVGPLDISLRLPPGVRGRSLRLTPAAVSTPMSVKDGWAHFSLQSLRDHVMAILE